MKAPTPAQREWLRLKFEECWLDWPAGAPAELAGLTPERAAECFAAAEAAYDMPDAELLPEIAAMRNVATAQVRAGWQAVVDMGETFLALQAKHPGAAFDAFLRTHAPRIPRAAVDISMRAALEAREAR